MHLSFSTNRAERVAPGLGIVRRMSRPLIAFLMGLLATACAFAQQPVGFPFQDNTFQTWTVPDTGWYLLDVSGAQGGDASNGSHAGGKGAQIQASVRLTKGEVLRIAVGGQGGKGTNVINNPSGGGGGGSSSIVRVKNTAAPLAPSANDELLLIVGVADMPAYLTLTQRLFTSDANVRNVKAFFSVKRSKFEPKVPLALIQQAVIAR